MEVHISQTHVILVHFQQFMACKFLVVLSFQCVLRHNCWKYTIFTWVWQLYTSTGIYLFFSNIEKKIEYQKTKVQELTLKFYKLKMLEMYQCRLIQSKVYLDRYILISYLSKSTLRKIYNYYSVLNIRVRLQSYSK